MSVRDLDEVRTLGNAELEEGLQMAARAAGLGPLDRPDVEHLIGVLTSHVLVATSLVELIQFNDLVDAKLYPVALRLLEAEADASAIHRALAVPDHVRILGDKCLFEAGVAGRKGPRGVDLTDVGKRSYQRAAQMLTEFSQDARLRRYYQENKLNAVSLETDVEFLARWSERFSTHVQLLQSLVAMDPHALIAPARENVPAASAPVPSVPTVSEPPARVVKPVEGAVPGEPRREDPAARSSSTALAPRREDVAAPSVPAVDDDGPARLVNLRIAGRSEEEEADDRLREMLAAEKIVLFSALDTENLRDELKKVVICQEPAIDSLCDELSLYSTGTQDPGKPASYFMVGPTGVGKNYLVESMLRLFERLWGIEVPYLELEGPEFTYPSDINELKGAARGFIRSDEEGIMSTFHKRSHDKPFSAILVDEVEKAHPQLRRFFLPIMDRGVMMDNRGKTLHFNNAMIFFTSNVGYSDASRSTQPIGFGDDASDDRALHSFVDGKMRKTLSPEFINRVHVIHFQHLTRGAVNDIFDLELAKIRRRYRTAQHLDIIVTPAARLELLSRGYSRDYGARNLGKVLNRWVNIEVSKTLKRDEGRHMGDVMPVLSFIRSMREGKRPVDFAEMHAAVEEVARIRVPYSRIAIDFEQGEFIYRRG